MCLKQTSGYLEACCQPICWHQTPPWASCACPMMGSCYPLPLIWEIGSWKHLRLRLQVWCPECVRIHICCRAAPVVTQPQYLLASCHSAANPVLVLYYAFEFCSSLPAEVWVALCLVGTACPGSHPKTFAFHAWLICCLCMPTVIGRGWLFQEQFFTIFMGCHSV